MINGLGQDIELRNIQQQPENLTELAQGSGKTQIACLRMNKENDVSEWLYELDKLFVM